MMMQPHDASEYVIEHPASPRASTKWQERGHGASGEITQGPKEQFKNFKLLCEG